MSEMARRASGLTERWSHETGGADVTLLFIAAFCIWWLAPYLQAWELL